MYAFLYYIERANLRNYWSELENIIFLLDSQVTEDGYRLYNITLRPIGVKLWVTS